MCPTGQPRQRKRRQLEVSRVYLTAPKCTGEIIVIHVGTRSLRSAISEFTHQEFGKRSSCSQTKNSTLRRTRKLTRIGAISCDFKNFLKFFLTASDNRFLVIFVKLCGINSYDACLRNHRDRCKPTNEFRRKLDQTEKGRQRPDGGSVLTSPSLTRRVGIRAHS